MYEIIDVTSDAGQLEPMGSKPKFWLEDPRWGVCLFKAARPGSGEDWSEKVAEQFAAVLGIPHARYELALWKGDRGIVTPRLTADDEVLVHGNEILIELDRDYEAQSAGYRTPLHTVTAVMEALDARGIGLPQGWDLPDEVTSSSAVLAGYLLLDALIGNTDRHHENWAAVKASEAEGTGGTRMTLAPSFDHASSLGRNERTDRMKERLETHDRGFTVEAYADRARSALYSDPLDPKPLSPLEAFGEAADRVAVEAIAWCQRLGRLSDKRIREVVELVPTSRMVPEAKEFVIQMVCHNRHRLEELCRSV